MRNLVTVERLLMPWFNRGKIIIADSWFGSPEVVSMLNELGLYSIMHVMKRRYWSRGMSSTDIVDQDDEARNSHYTMHKTYENGMKIFLCAYRDLKVKTFVSSCSTTTLENYKSVLEPSGEKFMLHRPQVVEEYEAHKSRSENCQKKNKSFIITFPLGAQLIPQIIAEAI
jgi:hypothetical protein